MSTRAFSQCAAILLLTLQGVAPLRAAEPPHYVSQFAAKDGAAGFAGDFPRRWKSQTSGNVFEVVLRDRVLSIRRVASEDEGRVGFELKIDVELRQFGVSYVGKTVVNMPRGSLGGLISTCPIETDYTISTLTSVRIEGSFVSRSLDSNCPNVSPDPAHFVWSPTSDTDVSRLGLPSTQQVSKEASELAGAFDRAFAEKKYDVAASFMQEAIAVVRNQFGMTSEAEGLFEGHLGLAYEGMGNVEEAIKAYQRSTEILVRVPSAEETLWKIRVNLSHALFKVGKRHEAITLYKLLLKHWEESKGELHINTFTTRGILAAAYGIIGQFDEAITQGKILAESAKNLYGQDSEQLLDAEGLLATSYMAANKLELAAEVFSRVYPSSERIRGEIHPKTLGLGYGYANVLHLARNSAQAVSIVEKVYRGRVAMNAPLQDLLEAQDLFGRLLGFVGKFEEGERLLLDGLQVATKANLEKQDITAGFMDALCALRTNWGREAITVCRESLNFAESAMGRDSLRASYARQSLSHALEYVGDHDVSAMLLETDLTFMVPKFGEKHYNVLITMHSLVGAYAESGRAEEARPFAEKSYYGLLETFGPENVYTQEAKLGLAVIHIKLGQDSQALALLEQIVNAAERGGVPNIAAKRELARVYNSMGRKDDAEKMILAALTDVVTQHGLTPHRTTSSVLMVLASSIQRSGSASKVLPIVEGIYKQTLEQRGPLHPETLIYLQAHAYFLLSAKDFEPGIKVLLEALDRIDDWRLKTSVFNKGRAELWATFSLQFRVAAYIGGSQVSGEAMNLSFQIADRAKTGTLYERLSIKKILSKPGAESKEFAKLLNIERSIERTDSQLVQVEKDIERFNLSLERRNLVSAHESLLESLAKKFPALLQARIGAPVNAARIAESLSPDAAFISYLLTPEGGLAYVITKDGGLIIRKIAGAPSLSQTILAAREVARVHPSMKGITLDRLWRLQDGSFHFGRKPSKGGTEVRDENELFGYLGKLLIGPFADVIKGKKRLIVSSDELIALLPLEMLKLDGRYLIELLDMSYVQSGAMYLLMAPQEREYEQRRTRQRSLLAVGGAEYGSKENSANARATIELNKRKVRGTRDLQLQWEPLPGSKAEVEGVGALFDDRDRLILLGNAASEEGLRKLNAAGELKRYQYLLFSAHGYLSDGDPLLSAIVLTPTGTTDDSDGYLTAVELAEYRLNARLLVLSACDTGVGRYVPGEGVQGLPVAAFLAGAESTLMSLWAVVDETTAEFMKTVFRKLVTGKTGVEAVSETKREFIANKVGLANPLFWAPFALYGI